MLEPRLQNRLDDKKAQLDALRPLDAGIVIRLREQINLEWIYHSNAIEGNTLTLQETRLILETGLTIGGKSLREHFEVTNHQEAIKYVEYLLEQDVAITPQHVRQIHKLVLREIDNDNAGQYRRTQVRIAGADHTPPEAWEVSRLMAEWSDWLHQQQTEKHPVALAALAHHRLVAIHPFIDGNGRTARLVMNLSLMRKGYPPTVIRQTQRKQYYRVLAQADNGAPEPLVNFVGRNTERSLTLYLEACTPQTAPKSVDEKWIPLREAANASPYSQEYLSLLARKGHLEAIKRGRNWYTTKNAIQEYRESLE
ncbi:MAG: Fic family protein [Chloroflexota bacterium]|nr:MAG: Fic family protein [Chloroflexota bacterium]